MSVNVQDISMKASVFQNTPTLHPPALLLSFEFQKSELLNEEVTNQIGHLFSMSQHYLALKSTLKGDKPNRPFIFRVTLFSTE